MGSSSSRGSALPGRSRLALATALALYGAGAIAASGLSPNVGADHVVLPPGIYTSDADGRTLVHDYGAFQLWRINPAHRAELRAVAPRSMRLQRGQVDLPYGMFDPVGPSTAASAPDHKWPALKGSSKLHVVQFNGPIIAPWLERVRATGAIPVQYVNENAYLVLAGDAAAEQLARATRAGDPALRFVGPVEAHQKVGESLRRALEAMPGEKVKVAVVLASYDGAAQSQRELDRLGSNLTGWSEAAGVRIARFELDPSVVQEIAAFGDVLSLSFIGEKRRFDEVQAQIMAGNLTVPPTAPSGPGYVAWLAALGLSTNPADYPLLAIVDDGIGNGTTVLGAGDPRLTVDGAGTVSRIAFATSCGSDASGNGGHGHINSTIAAGFDTTAAFPNLDPNGFLRAHGVNPFARVANFEIFTAPSSGNCGSDDLGLVNAQGVAGVKISSNSWGYGSIFGPATDYLDSSRFHDIGARDADPGAPVAPIFFVYAAGNDGDLGVSSPGNAKNVITVGASENVRPSDEGGNWTDGCGSGPTDADNAMDVADFSSLGPAVGGRAKPEVIAPGVHIQGSASTAPGYTGASVCDQFRPSGQTSIASSTGTSHSTPAVAGAATMYFRHLQDMSGVEPSPALQKAYMIAHPTYLTGVGANDSLPSDAQGFGMPNMGYAFDESVARYLEDQEVGNIFTIPGQTRQWFGGVADTSQPFRVVLAWTDAPGAVDATEPDINDLDLVVTVDGTEYLGNVFTGAMSSAGGTADSVNNTEVVFLPAGTSGVVEVEVVSAGINGDGVPGGPALDQDYALVIVNGTQTPTFTMSATPSEVQVCGSGDPVIGVDVGSVNGYVGTVSLSTTGLPGFASSSFTPASGLVDPSFSSVLDLTVSAGTSGDYPFQVVGNDGTDTRSDTVTLQYSVAAATGPALDAPADAATDVSPVATLSWIANPDALSYTVEIDDDPAFGSIDVSGSVAGTSFTVPSRLAFNTQYHWRVRSANHCGEGDNSASRTFTTGVAPVVLLVDDTHGATPTSLPAYVATMDAVFGAGSYDTIIVSDDDAADEPDASVLANYDAVIWFSGDTFNGSDPEAGPITATEVALASWLDDGNCLLISAQDYLFDQDVITPFMVSHLGVGTMVNDPPSAQRYATVNGQGSVFGGIGPSSLTYPTGHSAFPDHVTPAAGAELAFNGPDTAAVIRNAGINKTTAEYFTTFLGFSLEILPAPDRQQIVDSFASACPEILGFVSIDAQDDAASGSEDTTLVQAAPGVLGNDTTSGTEPLTAALEDAPATGAVTLNPDGSFSYVPELNVCGEVTFTYTATDGAVTSDPALVTLDMACVNDAPTAAADSYIAVEDGALAVPAPGVLANDSDIEGNAFTAVLATQAPNGTALVQSNGGIQYIPDADFCGADAFTYQAVDAAPSVPATVALDVLCTNDSPEAIGLDDVTLSAKGSASIAASAGFTEPDGDALTYEASGLPPSLSIDANTGLISGALSPADIGSYDVTVTATDPFSQDDSFEFTIEVIDGETFNHIFSDGFDG